MPPKRKAKRAAATGKKVAAAKRQRQDQETEQLSEVPVVRVVGKRNITPPDRKEVIEDPLDSGEYAPPVVLREPAFLATCRQIRSETSHVFYGENHFSVRFALYGPKFVRQLGPERTAMLTSLTACGVEQARWVTSDRLMHAAVWHVNRLLEAAGGALHPDAVLVPVGHGAIGGWQRLTEAKDMCVVDKKGEVCVEWVARALEPALSIFEY